PSEGPLQRCAEIGDVEVPLEDATLDLEDGLAVLGSGPPGMQGAPTSAEGTGGRQFRQNRRRVRRFPRPELRSALGHPQNPRRPPPTEAQGSFFGRLKGEAAFGTADLE